jgi:hypothetical protein
LKRRPSGYETVDQIISLAVCVALSLATGHSQHLHHGFFAQVLPNFFFWPFEPSVANVTSMALPSRSGGANDFCVA